jgi:hypothetical protein
MDNNSGFGCLIVPIGILLVMGLINFMIEVFG